MKSNKMIFLHTMNSADILVFRGINNLYTYKIPDTLHCNIGDTVNIPIGKGKGQGLIVALKNTENLRLKPIESIVDTPKIEPDLIELILWFKDQYFCTPFKSYQTIVGNKKERVPPTTHHDKPILTAPSLTEEQTKALAIINTRKTSQFLIHGVTGSGKTELYMQLSQTQLDQNKQTILLVPEIALTPQFTQVFEERFGNNLVVIHSGLTPKQKEEAWARILNGHADIVIGPRSAIFAPLKHIGAIIIDEEHEPSYKQDQHPRYYTHDIAAFRARQHNALLILGSATPTIDTYYNAITPPSADHTEKSSLSELGLIELKHRIHNRPLPEVTLIDLQQERENGDNSPISMALLNEIKANYERKQKTIILINRRGFAPFIVCNKCRTILDCPHCAMGLTYHKDKFLRCHRCHRHYHATQTCPKCKKPALAFGGQGTQKIEVELKKWLPDASILRLDKDTGKTPKKLDAILTQFKKDGDILIGTQMIAKGHHIEAVTLVGVLGIDTLLNIPDFRSPERAFQLLTQVAGRAGRGDHPGKVLIQTHTPHHYAIKWAQQHDFNNFYNEEIQYRKSLTYPPFCTLLNIIFSSKQTHTAKNEATKTGQEIKDLLKDYAAHYTQIGPLPAPIEKINDYFRWHILLKMSPDAAQSIKNQLTKLSPPSRQVRVIIDSDPRSIL